MSKFPAFTIEVDGESAGLVVAERSGFTFFAASGPFFPLDRRNFKSVGHAERAARDLKRRPTAARTAYAA